MQTPRSAFLAAAATLAGAHVVTPPPRSGGTAATIHLCSVLSLSDRSLSEDGQGSDVDVPCGNNPHFVTQVEAMVSAIRLAVAASMTLLVEAAE